MTDQKIHCPDCGESEYSATVLAVVGPKDMLGLRCVSCGRTIAKVSVESAHGDVRENIAEMYE